MQKKIIEHSMPIHDYEEKRKTCRKLKADNFPTLIKIIINCSKYTQWRNFRQFPLKSTVRQILSALLL